MIAVAATVGAMSGVLLAGWYVIEAAVNRVEDRRLARETDARLVIANEGRP